MELEHKICDVAQIEIKDGDGGHGELTGYAAVFANLDRAGDVIERGAFKDSIPAFVQDGFIAVGHDHHALPVAMIKEAREDDYGLRITAKFHSTQEAQSARKIAQERIREGKSVALSIGYLVPEGGSERKGNTRLLKRVDVFETSLVKIPANPSALVVGVKDVTATEQSFDDRLSALATEVEEVATELKHQFELRVKEGRVMATRRRERMVEARPGLASALEIWDELLSESEARSKEEVEQAPTEEAPKGYPVELALAELEVIRMKMGQFSRAAE